mmetsp:Transcript_6366/g.16247  ORF Transcript_6366/g.16247 Transcript_6366/m.16247 type:complete len:376 (-) Transcript_6366:424-1551(-)
MDGGDPMSQVTVVGLALAALSMVGNGSFGIFGKLCRKEPDPVLFNSFLAVGVMLSSLLPMPFLARAGFAVGLTLPGAIAGCLLVVATLFSFIAISLTGLSNAQATWSCAAITCATLWGALGPQRGGKGPGAPMKSVGLTILALCFLVAGVMVINAAASVAAKLFCGSARKKLNLSDSTTAKVEEGEGNPVSAASEVSESSGAESDEETGSWLKALLGLVPALLVGLSGGSVLVPMSFAPKELAGVPILLSFGSAAGIVGVLVGAGYWTCYKGESLSLRQGSSLRKELGPDVILYGIASGVCWNAGNICQIIALHDLHMPYGVSYPILQCALVVAGLWGIFVFREVTDPKEIAVFFVGVGILLIGVVLLGLYGPGA